MLTAIALLTVMAIGPPIPDRKALNLQPTGSLMADAVTNLLIDPSVPVIHTHTGLQAIRPTGLKSQFTDMDADSDATNATLIQEALVSAEMKACQQSYMKHLTVITKVLSVLELTISPTVIGRTVGLSLRF